MKRPSRDHTGGPKRTELLVSRRSEPLSTPITQMFVAAGPCDGSSRMWTTCFPSGDQ